MFTAQDPDGEGYRIRAHLAEIIALLGLPPLDLVDRGGRSHLYFNKDGMYSFFYELKRFPFVINRIANIQL